MEDYNHQALEDFMLKRVDLLAFMQAYRIEQEELSAEVEQLFAIAQTTQDADLLDMTMTLAYRVTSNTDRTTLFNYLIQQPWHLCHEDMIRYLQAQESPTSVEALRKAIALKPQLTYLDYDDYGSYYKKCLWALAAIGTREAIAVIRDCVESPDDPLRAEAEYRLSKIC